VTVCVRFMYVCGLWPIFLLKTTESRKMFTKHNSGKSAVSLATGLLSLPLPSFVPKTVNRARRAVKVRTDSKDTESLAPHAESPYL